jgi:branched-chain amino acid transport system ATP-binding protein
MLPSNGKDGTLPNQPTSSLLTSEDVSFSDSIPNDQEVAMVSRNLLRQLDSFSEGIEADLLTVFPASEEWLPAEVDEFSADKVVTGRVRKVSAESVWVDVGFKSEGIIELREWHDQDASQLVPPKVGDAIDVLVETIDDGTGAVVLSYRRAKRHKAWELIVATAQEGDTVSGTVSRSGAIELDGKAVKGGPEAAAKSRIAHVPEGRGTFVDLTVLENLKLGAYTRRDRSVKADIGRISEYFPWIVERGGQRAGTLSGGEQQMLALGRALMSRPRLLLLDEPSLGLAPMIVREFFRIVGELNEKEGLTVLVVEQDARIALKASQRAYVLEVGRVALTGTSDELRGDESIRKSYLGY